MLRALPLLLVTSGCDSLRATIIENYPSDYEAVSAAGGAQAAQAGLSPAFDGVDAARTKIAVRLVPVVGGLKEPTDLQFVPGAPDRLVALEKGGAARMLQLSTGSVVGTVLTLDVLTRSEQGLLGLAFHPDFGQNGRFYVNHSVDVEGQAHTRVTEFTGLDAPGPGRVVIEIAQPYANHNGGQVVFGPDGMLYLGMGDGGWRDDPKGHGQNGSTLLGSMLRIDVDARDDAHGYGVPPDNPWVGVSGVAPEAWAIGLRNPWRFSFTPDGRLLVADVGQNTFEEVDLVSAGDNLGWRVREGRSCFPPGDDASCPAPDAGGLQDPIYAYDHDEGASITGGFVYTGASIPALRGRYVFGDFVSGRLWAITVPAGDVAPSPAPVEVAALGRFPVLLSTFAQGPDGELYVADFKDGTIYRLAAAND
jgi:glucose/arabinose dehydrogenase